MILHVFFDSHLPGHRPTNYVKWFESSQPYEVKILTSYTVTDPGGYRSGSTAPPPGNVKLNHQRCIYSNGSTILEYCTVEYSQENSVSPLCTSVFDFRCSGAEGMNPTLWVGRMVYPGTTLSLWAAGLISLTRYLY